MNLCDEYQKSMYYYFYSSADPRGLQTTSEVTPPLASLQLLELKRRTTQVLPLPTRNQTRSLHSPFPFHAHLTYSLNVPRTLQEERAMLASQTLLGEKGRPRVGRHPRSTRALQRGQKIWGKQNLKQRNRKNPSTSTQLAQREWDHFTLYLTVLIIFCIFTGSIFFLLKYLNYIIITIT